MLIASQIPLILQCDEQVQALEDRRMIAFVPRVDSSPVVRAGLLQAARASGP